MNGLAKIARYESSVPQIEEGVQGSLPERINSFWDYVIHRHDAKRRGSHLDLRLKDSDQDIAHSWALPKLPKPGEWEWAIRQPGHRPDYMQFSGDIKKGYGAGKVSIDAAGRANVIASNPRYVKFLVPDRNTSKEFSLVNIIGDKWKLFNRTPKLEDMPELGQRPKYRNVSKAGLPDPTKGDEVWQPKLDGASSLIVVRKGQYPRIFSNRIPSSDRPIEHTYKILSGLTKVTKLPGNDVRLRGEIVGIDRWGKAVPPAALAGILNSTMENAKDKLKERKIDLKVFPYYVESIDGEKPVDAEHSKSIIDKVVKQVEGFRTIPTAETYQEKKDMLSKILKRNYPLTQEGIVIWNKEHTEPRKYKIIEDHDVYIRGIVPSDEGKYAGKAAGGFTYSHTPGGKVVGKCGSGFTDAERIDMLKNPDKWVGHVAVVAAKEKMSSGALFQPSFLRIHLDK